MKRNLTGDILLRDSHSRHSPDRFRIQPGYLSIDKYSWQFPLILVYKTYTINKNSANIAGAVTTMPLFTSDLKKSNDGKFVYLVCSVLLSWEAS